MTSATKVTDWNPLLRKEFTKPYWVELQRLVKAERSQHDVYPPENEVFTAFHATSHSSLKVLILGQDPYPGPGQAHGLSFSVRPGVAKPASLRNIFTELHHDIGVPEPEDGTLTHWAAQGVFLLNSTLTVRAHQPASHRSIGWQTFTDEVVSVVNAKQERVVFILWGQYAQRKKSLLDAKHHVVICSSHPSPLSAQRGFFGSHPFSRANRALIEAGREPIDWGASQVHQPG